MTTVYLVRYGCYSDQGIAGVFSTQEKAQKYCDVHNEINDYDDYYVEEYELDEVEVSPDAAVVVYYYTYIALKDDGYQKAGHLFRSGEEKKILTTPVVITKDTSDSVVRVASIMSLDHAKKVAIEQYQMYTQQQLEDGVL